MLELKKGIEMLGDDISMDEVESILEKTNIQDGEIYYEDFIKLFCQN